MSELNEKIEDLQTIARIGDKAISWISITLFRRLIFFMTLLAVILIPWSYYMIYLTNTVVDEIANSSKIQQESANINLIQSSIEYIDLCINYNENTANKENLHQFYCNLAKNKFKDRLHPLEIERQKEIIDKNAYGIMKIVLTDKIRHIKNNQLQEKNPSGNYKLFKILLSLPGLIGFMFFVIFIFVMFAFFIYRKKSNLFPNHKIDGKEKT